MALLFGGIKMEREEILGYFNYKGNGKIYVKMGSNMRFGSEAVTYIHELYHDRLSSMSSLGRFLNFIGMAWKNSDKENKYVLNRYGDILVKHTRKVQEVYASTMTWLWLNQKGNEEYKKIYIDIEKPEYKSFRKTLEKITSNEKLCLEERKGIVDKICQNALNIDLDEKEFWNCISDIDEFDAYMETVVNPERRMNYIYNKVITEGSQIEEYTNEDEISFLEKLCSLKYFENMRSYIEMLREQFQELKLSSAVLEKYYLMREKKIKVFDFAALKVYRGEHNVKDDIDAVCIIKQCENLEDKEKSFYVITHSNYKGKSNYLSQELSEIQTIIESNNFVIIPFAEYNKRKWKPKYFKTNKPIFVFIDNYDECADWARDLLDEGEIFWGDIYSKEVNNFFTVNFFSKRGKKDVIFVFPTTKRLAIILQKELQIEGQVLYSKQEEFFKIFGCFHRGIDIFKVYRNLMAFILDSSGSCVDDIALRMMSIDVFNTIGNSCLNIFTPDNCFEQMMFYPTRQTVGNGKVWMLMEFKEGERFGNIKVEKIKRETETGEIITIEGILVFGNKMDAINYSKQNRNLECFYPVEMDMIFWNYFKPKLIPSKWKIFLCTDIDKMNVQIIDGEKLEYMLFSK